MAAVPFKISIADSEVERLKRKLEDARLPTNIASAEWGEENGVSYELMSSTVDYWKKQYSWRDAESNINTMPQYTIPIEVPNFGTLSIHFVHAPSPAPKAVPLLFLHGWPGSFLEVQKMLPILTSAGFHVVAPSLPGFGFSSYPDQPGYTFLNTVALMHQLMQKLGYDKYTVQGGDWGAILARSIALSFPENVRALHTNLLVFFTKPDFVTEPSYTAHESAMLQRSNDFQSKGAAYQTVQKLQPRTLGYAMHDSPIGMLAWMADKCLAWSDDYPWTPEELITWTLMHYWPGPTTAFNMYHENSLEKLAHLPVLKVKTFVKQPTGVSAFPGEVSMVPRLWAETESNIQFYMVHDKGGHFAAWERPEELATDLIEFFQKNWS